MTRYLGFNRLVADSQGFSGVNPKYLATAESGGTSFEISPFGNRHSLLENSANGNLDIAVA